MTTQDEAAPAGQPERQGLDGDPIHPQSTRPKRIYLAAPKTCRGDRFHYPACLARVQSEYPDAEVVEGLWAYAGLDDWLHRYAQVVRSCDQLVFVRRESGSLSAGVLREIVEAVIWEQPVSMALPRLLVPVEQLEFRFLSDRTPQRLAVCDWGFRERF